jgi:hypothetical protein
MLPRQLVGSLRERDWVSLGVEVMIVVLGVFLGMEVSNWNEDRQNRALGASYLERIEADLEAELAIWEDFLSYFSTTRTHARSALDGFVAPKEQLDQTFLVDLYQSSQERSFSTRRATYEELVATGGLEYIQNRDLRAVLVLHYDLLERREATMMQLSDYREVLRSNMDHRVQSAIVEACGDRYLTHTFGFVGIELPENCSVELSPSLVEQEIRRLHGSAVVLQTLRYQESLLTSRIASLENAVQSTTAMLAAGREAG